MGVARVGSGVLRPSLKIKKISKLETEKIGVGVQDADSANLNCISIGNRYTRTPIIHPG